MPAKRKAGNPRQVKPARKYLTNILPQEMSGRELLYNLAANVKGLCELVLRWRAESDQLRTRVAVLEKSARHSCSCRRFSA
jgi:hypothetical protein